MQNNLLYLGLVIVSTVTGLVLVEYGMLHKF